jgi:hypothetical protein
MAFTLWRETMAECGNGRHDDDMEGVAATAFAGLFGALLGVGAAALPLLRLLRKVRSEQSQTRAAVEDIATALTDGDQAWFWTPEWQDGEREADEDMAAGRSVKFRSVDEMASYFDRVPHAAGRA